jgi:hypothetical protein
MTGHQGSPAVWAWAVAVRTFPALAVSARAGWQG